MVSTPPVRQFHHANRALSAAPGAAREQCPLKRAPRVFDQSIIPARTVDFVDKVDERAVQFLQDLGVVCIFHVIIALSNLMVICAYYTLFTGEANGF
ncbi:MAG: hypothetical protein ABF459_14235 [Gluconobacter cerinus]|uniref:hypothetical protein n=1 Tax=Gluconobacter cerinus TaxID=38307 RepID=UPI0039EB6772